MIVCETIVYWNICRLTRVKEIRTQTFISHLVLHTRTSILAKLISSGIAMSMDAVSFRSVAIDWVEIKLWNLNLEAPVNCRNSHSRSSPTTVEFRGDVANTSPVAAQLHGWAPPGNEVSPAFIVVSLDLDLISKRSALFPDRPDDEDTSLRRNYTLANQLCTATQCTAPRDLKYWQGKSKSLWIYEGGFLLVVHNRVDGGIDDYL